MPEKRSPDKEQNPPQISDQALLEAQEAWSLAWQYMLKTGEQMVKSNNFLGRIKDKDVEIAETPADVVFEIDKVRLFRYRPLAEVRKDIPPMIICYGLFGRQTMIDLQEDRSLVRNLLMAGIDLYVVDWGNPTRADQYLNFDDYVERYLGSCVEYLYEANDKKPVNLFGICEGGTFAAMLAALRPELFAGLALAITPIDFHGDQENFWRGEGFLNSWVGNLSKDDVDLLIDTHGMLPGEMTGAVFSALTPIASMTKYNIGLARMEGNEAMMLNFLRMEKWIADRPDHPGEAARQWLNDLYRENLLVKGQFMLCGEKLDLSNITCPVLNIFAEQDHIIPVSCSKAMGNLLSDDQYEEIGFPGGHVGVFVSRKAQGVVAGGVVSWLEKRLDPLPDKKQKNEAGVKKKKSKKQIQG